jgi:hypothetical protein
MRTARTSAGHHPQDWQGRRRGLTSIWARLSDVTAKRDSWPGIRSWGSIWGPLRALHKIIITLQYLRWPRWRRE